MQTINFIIGLILIMLLVLWAIWSAAVNHPQKKKMISSGKRMALIKDYIQTIIGLVIFGNLALIACGKRIFVIPEIYFLDNSAILKIFVYVIIAIIIAYQIISSLTLRRHNEKIPKNISEFLPLTRNEKLIFILVCMFAGIYEEMVFRGFALIFMEQFGINVWLVILISSLTFGLMHLYQGVIGFFASFFMGILLAMLFMISGNLLLPVIVHFITDICVVIVKKETKIETENL